MKGFIISALLLFLAFIPAQAQEKPVKRQLSDKVFFGGSFNLQFGSLTLVDISPVAGYHITPSTSMGLGATWQYYRNSFYDIKTSNYGGLAFIRQQIVAGFFAHAEIDVVNVEYYSSITSGTLRAWDTALFVGGGYSQQVGRRSSYYIMALWNLNQTSTSPYESPVFRVGFWF